jgi:hypothetical protein
MFTVGLVVDGIRVILLQPSLLPLGDSVELGGSEKANAQSGGNGIPFYASAVPSFPQSRPKWFIAVFLFGVVQQPPRSYKGSALGLAQLGRRGRAGGSKSVDSSILAGQQRSQQVVGHGGRVCCCFIIQLSVDWRQAAQSWVVIYLSSFMSPGPGVSDVL